MLRLNDDWHADPGSSSGLSEMYDIDDEQDWHDAFQERMEDSGWTLKHEVVCNEDKRRADFIGFHNKLNPSYEEGVWVGFELKYSEYDYPRALSAAAQIEAKYRDKTWSHSGHEIDLWVVAPYVERSHAVNPLLQQSSEAIDPKHQMSICRGQELQAASFLNRLGYGYLFTWHPAPFISYRDYFDHDQTAYPRFEEGAIYLQGIPAFESRLDPFQMQQGEYLCPVAAAECRVKSESGGLTYDRMKMEEEKNRVDTRFQEVGDDE